MHRWSLRQSGSAVGSSVEFSLSDLKPRFVCHWLAYRPRALHYVFVEKLVDCLLLIDRVPIVFIEPETHAEEVLDTADVLEFQTLHVRSEVIENLISRRGTEQAINVGPDDHRATFVRRVVDARVRHRLHKIDAGLRPVYKLVP
uniref:Uncharacterized protein n=1 Tax=Peronospora matthiolae TaxID=2874970 RepID=A0AAV1UNH1_9STRA